MVQAPVEAVSRGPVADRAVGAAGAAAVDSVADSVAVAVPALALA